MIYEQLQFFPEEKIFKGLSCLPFTGFAVDSFPYWLYATKKIVAEIQAGRNPCMTGRSGSGKTVVALMVHEALKKRSLLIAPTTNLVGGHNLLYQLVTGKNNVRTIIGETSSKNRIWNDSDDLLIICTAEAFLSEFKNDRIALEFFDFFMIDEEHHAVKEHAYVETAQIFHSTGKPLFSFTATLGDTKKEMDEIKKNCFVDSVIDLVVPMPKRTERKIDIPLDENLQKLHPLFEDIIGGITLELETLLRILVKTWLTEKDFGELKKMVNDEKEDAYPIESIYNKSFRAGSFLLSKYRQATHAYRLTINESYRSFLKYAEKLPCKNKSGYRRKSAVSLYTDQRFQHIISLVAAINELHPKEKILLAELEKLKKTGGRSLIFFQNKTTARSINELLKNLGYKTGYVFGGKEKKTEKAKEILSEMKECGIEHLLVTSVAEEGITVPAVNTVFNYNPPTKKTARIQRTGRIGRMIDGESVFLIMKNGYETGLFWKAFVKQPGEEILGYFVNGEYILNTGTPPKRKKRRGDDPRQMVLF